MYNYVAFFKTIFDTLRSAIILRESLKAFKFIDLDISLYNNSPNDLSFYRKIINVMEIK